VAGFNYPPEFTVSIDAIGQEAPVVLLGCMECGVHHWFADGVTLQTLNIEAEVHTQMHLREALTGGQ
jgi:hypothetical protein